MMNKVKKTKTTKVKVAELVDQGRTCLDEEKNLSPSFKETFSQVLDLVVALSDKLGVNSSNSSKPPSQDPNRKRRVTKAKGRKRKPGGQKGHKGSCLKQTENPTSVEEIQVD